MGQSSSIFAPPSYFSPSVNSPVKTSLGNSPYSKFRAEYKSPFNLDSLVAAVQFECVTTNEGIPINSVRNVFQSVVSIARDANVQAAVYSNEIFKSLATIDFNALEKSDSKTLEFINQYTQKCTNCGIDIKDKPDDSTYEENNNYGHAGNLPNTSNNSALNQSEIIVSLVTIVLVGSFLLDRWPSVAVGFVTSGWKSSLQALFKKK